MAHGNEQFQSASHGRNLRLPANKATPRKRVGNDHLECLLACKCLRSDRYKATSLMVCTSVCTSVLELPLVPKLACFMSTRFAAAAAAQQCGCKHKPGAGAPVSVSMDLMLLDRTATCQEASWKHWQGRTLTTFGFPRAGQVPRRKHIYSAYTT